MRINTNIAALNAWRNVDVTGKNMDKALERLSSGFRISRAADDAAGLAISEKMRNQISGLKSASANAQNAISLIQTAEGALNEVHSMLNRVRELAIQAATDTVTDADRAEMQKEVDRLKDEINRIGGDTEFNTKKLLNGSLTEATTIRGTIVSSVSLTDGSAAAVNGTLLQSLSDSSNNNFGLSSGVVINISGYVDSGTAFGATLTVVSGTTTVQSLLQTISGQLTLATGTVALSGGNIVITGDGGTSQAIWGVKLSATDKTLFNDKMSNFEETQAAQNTASDASLSVQIGANASQTMTVGVSDMRSDALAMASVDISTKQGGQNAITVVDRAITTVSAQRSTLGAAQNRLTYTINNLGVAVENLQASESRIRDVDMALEMTTFTRQQILVQAGTAMLAQANLKPQAVLQLLR